MKSLFNTLLVISVVVVISSCNYQNNINQDTDNQPYLVMLSLDGFRWDYCDKANTPVFDSLAKVGVKAESLKPSFPTKTFPNHYSMATGLYPDHHGIVLNSFHAPDLGLEYSIPDRDAVTNGDFYDGQPIWNVAEDNGIKTVTLFWVGSEAPVDGKQASYWYQYDKKLPTEARIDSLERWLSMPIEDRPHFIMWYYYEPDHTGHVYGPDSPEAIVMVEELDKFVGDFFTAMRTLPVFPKLNFIITSDHGMAQLSPDRVVFLDQYVDTADIEFCDGWNPAMNIKAKPGKADMVYDQLAGANEHLNVYKHGELPPELNYGTNERTQDITVFTEPGWTLSWSWDQDKSLGTHGFDNGCKDMHAIFYAAGPAFKKGYVQPTFNNVDLYPLAGSVLGIQVPESDGEKDNISGMLN